MEIAVAAIAAVGGVIVALVQRSRKENSDDHKIVIGALDKVSHQVDRLDGKVDRLDAKIERVDAKVERHIKDEPTG